MKKSDSNTKISSSCFPAQDELDKITLFLKGGNSRKSTEEQLNQLQLFVDLVLEENKHHNIIGKNTQQNIWTRHILDSLQLMHFIQNDIDGNDNYNIVDFGSGAGFPAIPLSIVLKNPILCIEKSPVKAQFLQNVVNKLKLKNVKISNIAIDEKNVNKVIANNTIIISRAFKSTDKILYLLKQPTKDNKIKKIVLPKGQTWQSEIDNTPKALLTSWKLKNYPTITGEGIIFVFEEHGKQNKKQVKTIK